MYNINCIGKPVLVVNGAYRGTKAILEALDTARFCVSVRINQVHSLLDMYTLYLYMHIVIIYFTDQCRDQHMEDYWREFHTKIYVNSILNHDNTYSRLVWLSLAGIVCVLYTLSLYTEPLNIIHYLRLCKGCSHIYIAAIMLCLLVHCMYIRSSECETYTRIVYMYVCTHIVVALC